MIGFEVVNNQINFSYDYFFCNIKKEDGVFKLTMSNNNIINYFYFDKIGFGHSADSSLEDHHNVIVNFYRVSNLPSKLEFLNISILEVKRLISTLKEIDKNC